MWPAGRRPDDNLPAAGQPNSRVRARHYIHRPGWVRWARGRASKVKRWRHTCARTSSPPPNSSPNLCPAWKPGCGDAESNHAGPPTDRDRCAAVDTPEDGLPDALSALQAYGKPLYHGLGAGRQAAQRCARGGRAPPARPTTQPPATLPAGSPPPHTPNQLPVCESRARLVTPPPSWAGQPLAQRHQRAAADCMFSGRIKMCAFGRGNPRREMNQVESQSQRLLCTCFSAVSTSEMQGSQHEFESFRRPICRWDAASVRGARIGLC